MRDDAFSELHVLFVFLIIFQAVARVRRSALELSQFPK